LNTSATDATAEVVSNEEAAGANGSPASQIEVHKPTDGSLIGSVPLDGKTEVQKAVARVRANQSAWEALGIKGRRRYLYELRDWLLDHEDEIADLMQAETGKVRAEAASETGYLTDLINFYGKKAKKFIGEDKVSAHSPLMTVKKLRVQYRPFEVVGVISPWNFPLILSLGDAIPALLAGCAVVIKPSELTPLALQRILKAWKEEIGAPDVFEVVNGMGETGSALVDEVDFVQFTGSDRTGKKVMAQAAERLTPVSLELGGNDAMIVLESAKLDRAVNAAAWGSFLNTGQVCMSVERIYVADALYDEFVEKLAKEVNELKQGVDSAEYGADVGAMTFAPQIDICTEHIRDAKEKGARVLAGGEGRENRDGQWLAPTVIADASPEMEVIKEESFGPVVAVMKVRDADEAVEHANASRHGLTGYVFGKPAEAEAVARRLEVGAACVNDVLINFLNPAVPMGGWKDSGIGFRHGEYGIKKFVRPESLIINRFGQGPDRDPFFFPYTKQRRALIEKTFRFFGARDWRRKLDR